MLSRPRTDRIFAGVCSGVARRFDVSPATVRVIAVLGVLFAGLPIAAYIILWIVMPSDSV